MAKKKKEKQEEPDLLKPLDIFELGGDKDPCFGKLYDLTTDECKRCGDSELCAIATAQNMKAVRGKIEKVTEFKDINNEIGDNKLRKFIERRKDKGYSLARIKKLAIKKLGADSKQIKEIYKSLK